MILHFSSFYILAAKKGPAKAAATKAASSSSEDSSDSEEDKAPAKPAAKVEGSIRIRHSHDSLLLLHYLACYPFIKMKCLFVGTCETTSCCCR